MKIIKGPSPSYVYAHNLFDANIKISKCCPNHFNQKAEQIKILIYIQRGLGPPPMDFSRIYIHTYIHTHIYVSLKLCKTDCICLLIIIVKVTECKIV